MTQKFSLDTLIGKYIRSATNGWQLSIRTSKFLTLIIALIWSLALIKTCFLYADAIKAIPKYSAIQKFKTSGFYHDNDDNNHYGGHIHAYWYTDGESTHHCSFDEEFWQELGITNPNHKDSVRGLVSIAEGRQEGELYKFLWLPIFILLLGVIPWVLTYITFWVIDTGKKTGINSEFS